MSNDDGGCEHDAVCGRNGCNGKITSHALDDGDGCRCHISPPCGFCVDPGYYCDKCGWDAREIDRIYQEAEKTKKKWADIDLRFRKLDDKLDLAIRRIDAIKQGKVLGSVTEELVNHPMNGWNMYYNKYGEFVKSELIPLDNTKISWRSKSHSSCSMIKEGVYPEGTTMQEVAEKVAGTFGGRFESFGMGKFRYIAYTD